jgi:hypothetical protein
MLEREVSQFGAVGHSSSTLLVLFLGYGVLISGGVTMSYQLWCCDGISGPVCACHTVVPLVS